MAHFAELNNQNQVVRVLVTDNNDANGDEGYTWIIETFGGRWIKTSYNGNIRKQFAAIGFTYDEINDVFIAPKPYDSWVLDDNFDWQAPTPKPGENYYWDGDVDDWVEAPAM